jgi:hypothetical protein
MVDKAILAAKLAAIRDAVARVRAHFMKVLSS